MSVEETIDQVIGATEQEIHWSTGWNGCGRAIELAIMRVTWLATDCEIARKLEYRACVGLEGL